MVVQLAAPRSRPPMWPAIPPEHVARVSGYRRGDNHEWEPTAHGLEVAAMAQRVVLAYALGYRSRAELAREVYLSETRVQYILRGVAHGWLTKPVRDRLAHYGLKVQRRPSVAVHADVRRVLEALAARASEMLVCPDRFGEAERERVSTDLYLLSGAWLEDGR